eukprot:3121886-Rhodomonas_salina.2
MLVCCRCGQRHRPVYCRISSEADQPNETASPLSPTYHARTVVGTENYVAPALPSITPNSHEGPFT